VFHDFPPSAAWIHEGARVGFEAVFIRRLTRGWRFSGHTTAVEDDRPWTVRYQIGVDTKWRTRRAEAWIWNGDDPTRVSLRHDGAGKWSVNGASASRLDGCMDVDFESSACTNTLPVHRLPGDLGQCEAPAAYVRTDGAVERLEQTYRRDHLRDSGSVFEYEAPRFAFSARLEYDRHGLVLLYPGIARRAL
jgi:hypothetical protein